MSDRYEKWLTLANRKLLRHILNQAEQGIHYTDAARSPNSRESKELTDPLVSYKNAWTRDMFELEQDDGKVDEARAKAHWIECMVRADREVNAVRQRYASRMAA